MVYLWEALRRGEVAIAKLRGVTWYDEYWCSWFKSLTESAVMLRKVLVIGAIRSPQARMKCCEIITG